MNCQNKLVKKKKNNKTFSKFRFKNNVKQEPHQKQNPKQN